MSEHSDQKLRQQLAEQLRGGQAFIKIEDLLEEVSYDKLGVKPEGLPYSFYELFFHMRVAQFDILDFSRNPDYEYQDWPDDYWPVQTAPANESDWEDLKDGYFSEREEMIELILDEERDLYKEFPHGDGQNLLREALLLLEHNAYHIGQLVILYRLLGENKS